jgi:hypothetical protein
MNQGPGWSPDGGRFWVRGTNIYWEDGSIGDLTTGRGVPCRVGIHNTFHNEDYSKWTDEQRAQVAARHEEARKKNKAEMDEFWKENERLCKSARAKLTEEEWDAVISSEAHYDGS